MKKFLVKISILLCLLSILGLAGCTTEEQTGKDNAPSAIAWNNLIYGPSGKEVSQNEIDKQLGEIKQIIKPYPKENGDSNYTPEGSKIFEIKGIDINDAVAVEIDGKYYEFTKKGSLDK